MNGRPSRELRMPGDVDDDRLSSDHPGGTLLRNRSSEKERDTTSYTPRTSDVFDKDERIPDSPYDARLSTEKRPPLARRGTSAGKERHSFLREMVFQTVPMLFLSLVGSVLAGEVLARLKFWPVFIRVEELFILVPIILNLKGNIEMNLSSRFSTSANIGELDIRLTRQTLVIGNLALLQVQALLVSFIAGLLAFVLGLASRLGYADGRSGLEQRGTYFECLMVLCASMLAASISSAIVGAFMCSLVVLSRRYRVNPDNIATPLAASLGDLLTLTILGLISSLFLRFMGTLLSTFVFFGLLCSIAVHVVITFRNAYVQELLWAGWVPLGLALVVSGGTGLVLEKYVNEFRGFGLLAPVITGIAGNVGAIFVSRISTALHASRTEHYWRTATTLFAICAPVLCLFLLFAWGTDQVSVTMGFVICYCLAICFVTAAALLIGYVLATMLWRFDYDPDINALPLLSSIIDVLGQLFLAGAFALTHKVLPPPTLGDVAGAPLASSAIGSAAIASATGGFNATLSATHA